MLRINCYAGETWRTEFYDADGDIDMTTFSYIGSLGQQDVAKINIVFNNIPNTTHVELVLEGSQTAALSAGTYYGEVFQVSDNEKYCLTKVTLFLMNPITTLHNNAVGV